MDKELRIRMVLDRSQFDASAKAANKTLQDTNKHLDDGTQSALNMGKAMLGVVGVQAGMQGVQQVIGAMNQSMQDAADYTRKVAGEFISLRESMREIAAITGKGMTNQFAQSQIDMAKRAEILTPQEMIGGVTAFQQFGSGYIGEGKGSRISQGQLDQLLPDVFAAAKVGGVEQGAAGQIFAKIVQAMPAHSKTSDYKDTFAKVMEMAKGSSGSATLTAKNLAPFLAENVGEGGSFAATPEGIMEATKLVATMSESHADEAGTYSRAMLQELTKIETKGKDNSFGITEDMTVTQKLESIRSAYMKETGGKKKFMTWFQEKNGGRMGNVHGIAGLWTEISKGLNEGFFDAMTEVGEKASGARLDALKEAHKGTAGGRNDLAEAGKATARAERGLEYSDVETLRTEAEGQLTREGAFEGWTPFANPFNWRGGKTVSDAQINQRALSIAQQQASEAGVDAYMGPDAMASAGVASLGQSELTLRNEMKRLIELTEQQNQALQRLAGGNVPIPIGGRPTVPGQAPR